MLAEDYSKTLVPYYYQVQERITGTDLGNVVQTLTDQQLKNLAKDIAAVINKIKTIPSTEKFGPVWGNGGEFSDTWTERMRLWIEETIERGGKTGVIDKPLADLAHKLYENYVPHFNSVKATTYYGDMCSKNVMIADGRFSGLVDLDALTQGDSLEAVGRMKTSWYGTSYGKLYSDAVMDELGLNAGQKKVVTAYALMSALAWTAENGIKFNENTTAVVDKEKEVADKKRVQGLASELGYK
jgi:aminoglycoside phosphotransferase (APT) family kinase protein